MTADGAPATPRRLVSSDAPAPHGGEAGRRVAAALRRLVEELVTADADPSVLDGMAATLDGMRRTLADAPRRPPLWDDPPDSSQQPAFPQPTAPGEDLAFFELAPLSGLSNPLSPPVEWVIDDDAVRGSVVFGPAYQGPPGCVHGGFVAAAFDELFGITNSISGRLALTGSLTVRYRRPTPLGVLLRLECRVAHVDGRRVNVRGNLRADGVVTAEADAVFVALDLGAMVRLRQAAADSA